MDLELELGRALERMPAPEGFTNGVMRRVEMEEGLPARPARPRFRGWRAVAAGMLLTAVAGGWAAQRSIERREGERARDEVMIALRIAGSKVRTAQQYVRDAGSR